MNIALALSGGGFRATVYHLGVLGRLAEENRLEDVSIYPLYPEAHSVPGWSTR